MKFTLTCVSEKWQTLPVDCSLVYIEALRACGFKIEEQDYLRQCLSSIDKGEPKISTEARKRFLIDLPDFNHLKEVQKIVKYCFIVDMLPHIFHEEDPKCELPEMRIYDYYAE